MPVPLIVGAAVVLVLAALFSLRLRFTARYDGELHMALRYAFFTLRLGKKPGKPEPKPEKPAEKRKKPEIRRFLHLFRQFSGSVKNAAGAFLRRLRIDSLMVDMDVCGRDAADTAITFGEACAAVYGGLGVLSSCVPVRRHTISIRPLYTGQESRVSAECTLSIRLGALLGVAVTQSAVFLAAFLRGVMAERKASSQKAKEGVSHE